MVLFNLLQGGIRGGHTFPECISPKVKVIARLEFELTSLAITSLGFPLQRCVCACPWLCCVVCMYVCMYAYNLT